MFSTVEAVASNPNRRILPGNHRPNYKQYGHNGLFAKGVFSGFRRHSGIRTNKMKTQQVAKKHRGTL
jgi:hypothetical protein